MTENAKTRLLGIKAALEERESNGLVMVKDRWVFPRIIEFPQYAADTPSKPVTDAKAIYIDFTYPLSHTVIRLFTNENGFNTFDLFKAIYETYKTIYEEEEAAVSNPGHVPGMLNRMRSEGPHGIWGHDMDDLYFEGFYEKEPNHYGLMIGS